MNDVPDISLAMLRQMMAAQGVRQLLVKELAANDNSKNQPYLERGSLGMLNVLPMGSISEEVTEKGNVTLKAPLDFSWLNPDGGAPIPAHHAKLILYPQYPEIRLSGFLKGTKGGPNALMTVRQAGRLLFIGVTGDRRIISWAAGHDSRLAAEIRALGELEKTGVLRHVPMAAADTSRERLLQKLRDIHGLGWLPSQRLYTGGVVGPCTGTNCGGYTLESHLDIIPNGRAEPDFEGWEIKGHTVADFVRYSSGPLTLMTPEPTGGYYKSDGPEAFVRKYGYPDKAGRPDRLNFGGVHKLGETHAGTGLTMQFIGYDPAKNRIMDPKGGFTLADAAGNEAATWHFAGLLAHWNKKHAKAAYVPFTARTGPGQQYSYGARVRLGEDTDFLRFLQAMALQKVYYDPGIKLEGASTARPAVKRRSQFRIRSNDISSLYATMTEVDVMV